MPLYEYDCAKCGYRFEALRRIDQRDDIARCLSCDANETVRVISRFNLLQQHAEMPESAETIEWPPPSSRTGPYGMVEITDSPAPGGGILIAPGSEDITINNLYSEHPGPALSLPTTTKNAVVKNIRRKTQG